MAKPKVEAAFKRIYNRVFVCMKCNAKIRADTLKVRDKKVKCRKCKSKALRPKKKERKV